MKKLRGGQNWENQLQRFIGRADVFQLFWSTNAALSRCVEQEWQHALCERAARPDPYFVRPVYWTPRPAEPIPEALGKLHFARVPL